jgi:hypothetical protein
LILTLSDGHEIELFLMVRDTQGVLKALGGPVPEEDECKEIVDRWRDYCLAFSPCTSFSQQYLGFCGVIGSLLL